MSAITIYFQLRGFPHSGTSDALSGPHLQSPVRAFHSSTPCPAVTPAGPFLWWPRKHRWALLRGSSTDVQSGIQLGKEEGSNSAACFFRCQCYIYTSIYRHVMFTESAECVYAKIFTSTSVFTKEETASLGVTPHPQENTGSKMKQKQSYTDSLSIC